MQKFEFNWKHKRWENFFSLTYIISQLSSRWGKKQQAQSRTLVRPIGIKVRFKPRLMLMPSAIRRDATGNSGKIVGKLSKSAENRNDNILGFRACLVCLLGCLATKQGNKSIEIFTSGWEQVRMQKQSLGTGFVCLCYCLLTQTPQSQLRCSPRWEQGQGRGCWDWRTGVGVCLGDGESAGECCHAETDTGSYAVRNMLQGTTYTHTQHR